jgi:hypothetical protein
MHASCLAWRRGRYGERLGREAIGHYYFVAINQRKDQKEVEHLGYPKKLPCVILYGDLEFSLLQRWWTAVGAAPPEELASKLVTLPGAMITRSSGRSCLNVVQPCHPGTSWVSMGSARRCTGSAVGGAALE